MHNSQIDLTAAYFMNADDLRHSIRNQLNAIATTVDVIKRDKRCPEHLQELLTAQELAVQNIVELLDYARDNGVVLAVLVGDQPAITDPLVPFPGTE